MAILEIYEQSKQIEEDAFLKKASGDLEAFEKLILEAFLKAEEAAMVLKDLFEKEPTRSIFFRRAALLAYNAKKYSQSKKLIEIAFTGNTLDYIKTELNQLLILVEKEIEKNT